MDSSSRDQLIDIVVGQLQVAQKIYNPPSWKPVDNTQYPVDYLYTGRIGLRLSEYFPDTRLEDLQDPTFHSAVTFCITGNTNIKVDPKLKDLDEEEFCKKLGINLIIVGSEPLRYRIIIGGDPLKGGFGILYRDMDDLYFPIVTLEQRENYLYYRQSNSILKKLLPESLE